MFTRKPVAKYTHQLNTLTVKMNYGYNHNPVAILPIDNSILIPLKGVIEFNLRQFQQSIFTGNVTST